MGGPGKLGAPAAVQETMVAGFPCRKQVTITSFAGETSFLVLILPDLEQADKMEAFEDDGESTQPAGMSPGA